MARILNDIKTERAQAAVDDRRTVNGLADIIASCAYEGEKANGFADSRVKSAERLRDAVVKALGRMHELLSADQREKLAYLLRTGALTI
jgi:hypothetical protein